MRMRRRDRYGYHTYYGGGGPSPVVKVIVIVLAVIVLSLLLAIWGLQRYMVYSEDGGKLVLPWAQQTSEVDSSQPDDKKDETDGASSALPNVDDVITDDKPNKDDKTDQQPQTPITGEGVQAVQLSLDELQEGDVKTLLEGKKADAVLLEMKAPDGMLRYVSQQEIATRLGRSARTIRDTATGEQVDQAAQTVQKLKEQNIYTIAYVDCFEDRSMGGQDDLSFITTYGYHWMGPNNDYGWGNPTKESVRNYLVGIVSELSAMGFDEILLYNAGFPTEGPLDGIRVDEEYDATKFAEIINDFYEQAAQAAEAGGAKLSVVTSSDTIQSGADAKSGQTLDNLSQLDRVWLTTAQGSDLEALEQKLADAGMTERPLGVFSDQLEEDQTVCQAVLKK